MSTTHRVRSALVAGFVAMACAGAAWVWTYYNRSDIEARLVIHAATAELAAPIDRSSIVAVLY